MAYLGRQPVLGNFVKLDAITVVNGQAAYTMQNGGVNFTDYTTVNQFLVSLNGTIQAATDSFTVSGSTITFASNLSTGDVIDFIIVFGNSLSAGTVSDSAITTAKLADSSVSLAKLTATGTKDATTFLRGDNTFASAGGGKVLQVQQSLLTATTQTSSTSMQDTGLSVTVTPASTSSKFLCLVNLCSISTGTSSTSAMSVNIVRDSTEIAVTNNFGFGQTSDANYFTLGLQKLDAPSTTSSTNYKVQFKNRETNTVTINSYSGNASTLTVMEIES